MDQAQRLAFFAAHPLMAKLPLMQVCANASHLGLACVCQKASGDPDLTGHHVQGLGPPVSIMGTQIASLQPAADQQQQPEEQPQPQLSDRVNEQQDLDCWPLAIPRRARTAGEWRVLFPPARLSS